MYRRNHRFWLPFWALVVSGLVCTPPARGETGAIDWFTLLTDDVHAAMGFYSKLFGWEMDSSPTGAYMALRDGVPFAGINAIADREPDGPQSLWLAAITVADIERSVATAQSLGGTVDAGIERLPGWGSYALIRDPQGAPALLVAPERPLGGTEGYSGWRWAELWTHDTAAAADFYAQVVGYELEEIPVGKDTYEAFVQSEKPRAGLVALEQPEIAPRWMPYVGVSDLRAVLVNVWKEGGKVLREPAEIDFEAAGKNRVALIADPTGAALFLYQLEARATVDPGIAARARSLAARTEQDADDPRVHIDVSYGFGAGWGTTYPRLPNGPFGPVPF